MKTGYVILIAVLALLVGSGIGIAIGYKKAMKKKETTPAPTTPAAPTETTTDENK